MDITTILQAMGFASIREAVMHTAIGIPIWVLTTHIIDRQNDKPATFRTMGATLLYSLLGVICMALLGLISPLSPFLIVGGGCFLGMALKGFRAHQQRHQLDQPTS